MIARTVVLSVTAMLGLAFLYFYTEQPAHTTTNFQDIIERDEPDLLGQGVLYNQMHQDGSLHYRLNADSIRQYNDDQITRMTLPILHLNTPNQPPWNIASKQGYIHKRPNPQGVAEDVVYLREDVQMVQIRPSKGQITLRSESFYIYPHRQFAQTNQNVMIDTSVGRTRAAGLVADLTSGVLKLSSNKNQRVHTIVLPEQFKNS
ncbi:MAG: LPS export ABC transporter periplasmic protein LptC [Gammaproteobacteria bacterium]|nr:LPS export ABC transporter periplasmic protein LptC [Gammaproteobacteria bacterium]